jgi:hypothetical protein
VTGIAIEAARIAAEGVWIAIEASGISCKAAKTPTLCAISTRG